ncbi:MAG: hypothetical protein R2873_36465 [Caldilineaceae bacterium]
MGLIYKIGAVTPFGDYQILDSTDDARFIDTLNRPVLAQTFGANADGERFTIAVNHLKSKGSDCLDVGGCGFGRQAGQLQRYTHRRCPGACRWLALIPPPAVTATSHRGRSQLLRQGRSHHRHRQRRFTQPDRTLRRRGRTWLRLRRTVGLPRSRPGVSPLDLQVTGTAEYHINAADRPSVLDYNFRVTLARSPISRRRSTPRITIRWWWA